MLSEEDWTQKRPGQNWQYRWYDGQQRLLQDVLPLSHYQSHRGDTLQCFATQLSLRADTSPRRTALP
jgi:hypothetical protein